MAQLEQITRGTTVRGILPNSLVEIVDSRWGGSDVVVLTYKDARGRLNHKHPASKD